MSARSDSCRLQVDHACHCSQRNSEAAEYFVEMLSSHVLQEKKKVNDHSMANSMFLLCPESCAPAVSAIPRGVHVTNASGERRAGQC